ncbi:MAG: HAD-IA family hydrolase [Bacillota bacterium]|jgi:phosphoglycolate phosphatase
MNKILGEGEYFDTIIFDLDGVVIDSAQDLAGAVQHTLKFLNCETRDYEYIRNSIGGGARNILLKCLSEDKKRLIDEAMRHFREYYKENCANKTVLYPGVAEVLEYYSGKKNIALATFKIRSATVRILKKLNVLQYFDVIITADDVEKPKPDPQCIEKILEKLNCQTKKVILIGDTANDLLTGKNAGIKTCAVLYGIGTEDEIRKHNPNYIIKNIMELKRIIL